MVKRVTSPEGIALIKHFESFQANQYVCPAGKLTIGYGHVIKPSDRFSGCISEATADELLCDDLRTVEIYLGAVFPAVPQCQFDALASFALNAGLGALEGSTLFKLLKAGDVLGAADQFRLWVKATDPITGLKVRLGGLVERREAERALFLKGPTT